MAERSKQGQPDWWLLIATLILISIGIIMVFSSSQYFAQYKPYYDPYYFLKSQIINAAVGAVAMVAAYKVNYFVYRRVSYPVFGIVIGLLLFMLLSSQIETIGGAQRWLAIGGFSFQPSELAKIALPMALAKFIYTHQDDIADLKRGFLPCIVMIGATTLMILGQKDLSSSLVVASAGAIIMLAAGVRMRYFVALCGAGLAAVVGAIAMEPYRLERVYAWFDPWAYSSDEGWQTVQSLMAIGSGGFSGVGLGSGGSKWYYLPERHTDFIFSVTCEELGFIGAVCMVLLIMFILWRGVMIAVKVPNLYASLLSLGITASLSVQSLINLGVCTGLLPVTGVTLPFVSYGGTSLVISMTMIGMLLNMSRYINKYSNKA